MKYLFTMLLITATLFVSAQDKQPAKTQCTAITDKGYRCTRPAQLNSTKCWQHKEHDKEHPQCEVITKKGKGKQCSRNAEPGTKRCWQHTFTN
jgi:hypothetical protein